MCVAVAAGVSDLRRLLSHLRGVRGGIAGVSDLQHPFSYLRDMRGGCRGRFGSTAIIFSLEHTWLGDHYAVGTLRL